MLVRSLLLLFLICFSFNISAAEKSPLDFSNAVVVTSPEASAREKNAVRVLVEEVEKRTGLRWKVSTQYPKDVISTVVVSHVDKLFL